MPSPSDDNQQQPSASASPSAFPSPSTETKDSPRPELSNALNDVLQSPDTTAPSLEPLWEAVLDRWDTPVRHEMFIQACMVHEDLAFAAGKYKTQQDNETRKELATEKLTAISLLMISLLETKRTPMNEAKKTPRWIQIVALLVCMASLWWLVHSCAAR